MTPTIRIGQIWSSGDPRFPPNELLVERLNDGYAYLRNVETGHLSRILRRRMVPRRNGYLLRAEPAARLVWVLSEADPSKSYAVWTGDGVSPAHCTCPDFQYAERQPLQAFLCKHLRSVLLGEGAS